MKRTKSRVMALLLAVIMLLPMAAVTACTGNSLPSDPLPIQIMNASQDELLYVYIAAGLRFGILPTEGGERFRIDPEGYITQGEFIAMLGRLHEHRHGAIGVPGNAGEYERYIDWALQMGLVNRYKYWDIEPYEFITREMMALIVYNYIDVLELDEYFRHSAELATVVYGDGAETSHWARRVAMELRMNLVMPGRSPMEFGPQDTMTHIFALRVLTRIGSAVYDLEHPVPWR